jgi:hypothetical protein
MRPSALLLPLLAVLPVLAAPQYDDDHSGRGRGRGGDDNDSDDGGASPTATGTTNSPSSGNTTASGLVGSTGDSFCGAVSSFIIHNGDRWY